MVTSVGGGAVRAWSWNQHYWKKALAAAGVIATPDALPKGSTANLAYGDTREFGFHAMRHTYASVQLDARESVVSVSKWLGHADPAITLRVYAHFMPEADGRQGSDGCLVRGCHRSRFPKDLPRVSPGSQQRRGKHPAGRAVRP